MRKILALIELFQLHGKMSPMHSKKISRNMTKCGM